MRLGVVMVVAAVAGCGGHSSAERARVEEMGASWIAAARAEKCPRPALRSPQAGDGSALLRVDAACSAAVRGRFVELEPCSGAGCALPRLETLAAYPDIEAACAPLHEQITQFASSTEACSPFDLEDDLADDRMISTLYLFHAVRVHVAAQVRRGELGAAARHVLDALRFVDDHARRGTGVGAVVSGAGVHRLAETLHEIVVDPRLAEADARAIARDLDVLLANPPPFDATMREENAWLARDAEKHGTYGDDEMVDALLEAERRSDIAARACCGSMHACAEELAAGGLKFDFRHMALTFARRDFDLGVERMQAELRIAPSACATSAKMRAALAPWLGEDRATLTDGGQVVPPAWHRIAETRLLACPW